MYHLQSDLDETSSEFDDSASTARLDVITKDQLYDAYKKSLDRYHKYRCRYTDLAKKYKELERDSSKARVCYGIYCKNEKINNFSFSLCS